MDLPEWSDVEDRFRQRFPSLDVEEMRRAYDNTRGLRSARESHRDWEPPPIHTVMEAIPFASSFRNFRIAVQHGRAQQRIDAGNPEPGDYDAVAQFERVQQLEERRSGTQQAFALGRHVTSMASEAAIGGTILRSASAGEGVLGAIPGVPRLLQSIGIGAELGAVSPQAGVGGVGVRVGQNVARTAVETAAMPGMYLEPWANHNIEAGRDPLDWRGLPPAFAVGTMQVALLGSIGRQANARIPGRGIGQTLTRMGVAGPVGVLESSVVDVLAGASGLQTGYGTIGLLLEGENDKAWRNAVTTAVTFAAFAGIHEAQGNRGEVQNRVMEDFAEQARRLRGNGFRPEAAAERLEAQLVEQIKGYGPEVMQGGRQASLSDLAGPVEPSRAPRAEEAQVRVDAPISPEQATEALTREQSRMDVEGRNARVGTNQPEDLAQVANPEPVRQPAPEAAPGAQESTTAQIPTEARPDANLGQPEPISAPSEPAGLLMRHLMGENVPREAINASAKLTPHEAKVFWERLTDYETRTLDVIGKELGVTRERARQIEAKAMEKIGIEDSMATIQARYKEMNARGMQEQAAESVPTEQKTKVVSWDTPRSPNELLSDQMMKEIESAQKAGKPVESLWLKWAEKLEKEAEAEFQSMKAGDIAFSFGPQLISPIVKYVAAKLIRGGYTFAQFTQGAVGRFGDDIKPHLQDIWDQANAMLATKPEKAERINPTSIKNEITDAERENRGYWPARMVDPVGHTFPELRDRAMQERGTADGLIESLRERPRTVSDLESAVLLQRHVEIGNRIEEARKAVEEARRTGNEVESVTREAEMTALESQHETLLDVVRAVGTESGRALNARKMMMNEDFTLANIIYKARKAKGSDLTDAERAHYGKVQKELADLRAKIEAKEAKPVEDAIDKEVIAKPRSTQRDPNAVRDVDVTDAQAVSRLAQRIAKDLVASGVKEREAVIDGVHEQLQKVLPEITRRETMDAISGYGIYTHLSKEQVDVELRDLKGQMQQLAKLEDMEAGQAPLKTGQERRTPSDTERRLIQEVEAAKKKGGFIVTDPEKQLKSALDAVKTRLRHQIDDLQHSIDTRTELAKKKSEGIKYDAIAEQLVVDRDALKEQYDAIFGKKEMTMEQRIRLATGAVERSIAEYERRIAEKDFSVRRQGVLKTPELDALRTRRAGLQEELKLLRDNADQNMAKPPELISRQAYRTYLANSIAKLQERIANKDFETKARPERVLDAADKKLRFEYDKVRSDFNHELAVYRSERRTAMEKAWDWAQEGSGFITSLKLGLDLMPVFRQGLWVTASHPVISARAAVEGFRAMMSKEKAHEVGLDITESENFKDGTYQRMGVKFTERHGELNSREEAFRSSIIGKVPVYAHLERATIAYMNAVRKGYADFLLATMTPTGKPTLEEAKILGNLVNVSTGRGNFGQFEGAVGLLSVAMLSPRYVLSRFQIALGQPLWHMQGKGSARVRQIVAMEYVRATLGVAGITAIGKLAFSDDDEAKTFFDPRSTDFLRPRYKNTRLDMLGGMQQPIVAMRRFFGGESVNENGVVSPGGAWRVITNFGRGRLGTVPGAIVNAADRENIIGDPMTPAGAARDAITPLSADDVFRAFKDVGIPRATAASIWAMFGGGLSVRERR